MNKRHYEHTLPNIRGSLSNTYVSFLITKIQNKKSFVKFLFQNTPSISYKAAIQKHEIGTNLSIVT